jgi:hypothetical protein
VVQGKWSKASGPRQHFPALVPIVRTIGTNASSTPHAASAKIVFFDWYIVKMKKLVPPKWNELGMEIFDVGQHADLDNKSFKTVWETRPKWVEFTLIWEEASGQYSRWLEYCRLRNKDEPKNQSIAE